MILFVGILRIQKRQQETISEETKRVVIYIQNQQIQILHQAQQQMMIRSIQGQVMKMT